MANEKNLAELLDDLEPRLTAARAGYLDNLNGHTAQTGDNYARLGAPAGASVSADIATVDGNVDTLLTRATEARLAELDAANLPSDVDAILADTGELQTDWADGGRLDLILDAASTHTAADSADSVWTEPIADHSGTSGSTAESLQNVENVVGAITGPTNGTTAVDTSVTTEVDLFEITGITTPTEVTITLNLENADDDLTIKTYEKTYNGSALAYAGTNSGVKPNEDWTTSDPKTVRIQFRAQADYKISATPVNGTGAGSVNIHFRHSRRVTS